MLKTIELFSGIGGLHYALDKCETDYEMIAAYDINTVANTVYKHNFSLKPTAVNLEHLNAEHFENLAADCWLLSPPCQPYTRGGKMLDDEDLRAIGLLHLIKILGEMKNPPKFLFLENVLNFECSRSRDRLIEVLCRRGYQVKEFLITPNDLWVAMPNDRLRYYLAAKRTPEGDTSPTAIPKYSDIVESLSEILGAPPNGEIRVLQEFLETEIVEGNERFDMYRVPTKYITDYKEYRHDVANPLKTRSTTFTKAYGSKYIIGTGSFLQTKHLDLNYSADDPETLLTLGLRFFTPKEIARLHAFPIDHFCDENGTIGFEFPSGITLAQQYRLLGNSLNVKVVATILKWLISSD